VPADPSSSIPAALAQLAHADALRPADTPGLLAYLATIHDPRRACGRRHPLVAILAMAAAAVLAGARSMAAIAEWAADAPSRYGPRSALGVMAPTGGWCRPRPPSAGPSPGWTPPRWPPCSARGWPTVTVAPPSSGGGRSRSTARPCGAPDATAGRQVHLLAAMDHTTRAVLAQRQVNGAPGEVPAFRPLLAGLDLAGTVVTADALHTHPGAAEFLVTGKQAHYLFCVKANQPTLLDRCQRLAWHRVPVLDRTRDHGHGRVELRTLKAVTVNHFGLPHAAQVLQVTRRPATCGPGGGGP
jgi:predicted transposase YbfD/YdcC